MLANGKYRLERKIGQGAMGSVYLASQTGVERHVAIKFLTLADGGDQARARFLEETRTTGAVNHPNVITVFDSGEETFNEGAPDQRTYPYMVMEYLVGLPLDEYIYRRGTVPVIHGTQSHRALPADVIVRIFTQICEGMVAIGAKGIVHRDLKPENIFICEDGGGLRVKILDLGIARITADPSSAAGATLITRDKTIAGAVIGSVHCMAPEQFRSSSVDTRADMYALACILYCLCMAICPHEDDPDNNGNLLFWVGVHGASKRPTPVTDRRTDLPKRFDRIIARGLAPRPDDRFQTASEFLQPFTNPQLMSDEVTPPEGLRLHEETIPPPAPVPRPPRSSTVFRASMYASLLFVCAAVMILLLSRLTGMGRDHVPQPRLNVAVTPIPAPLGFGDGGAAPIDRPTTTDRPAYGPDVPHLVTTPFHDGGVIHMDADRPDRPRRPVIRRRRCPPPVIVNGIIVSPPCDP